MANKEFQDQVDKAIQAEEDRKESPRELYEANQRFIKRYQMACVIDNIINWFKWSGWVVAAILLIKGC